MNFRSTPILSKRSSALKTKFEDTKSTNKSSADSSDQCKFEDKLKNTFPITWGRSTAGYRITELQIENEGAALNFFKKYCYCSDLSCAKAKLFVENNSIEKYKQFVSNIISDGNSFFAIEEGSGEILGILLAKIINAEDEVILDTEEYHSEDTEYNCLSFGNDLLYEARVNELYAVNRYFCMYMLCVKPDKNGKGIGTSLVQAYLLKAQDMSYDVCVGIFLSGPSETIARKFGFEKLAESVWMNDAISIENHYTRYSHMLSEKIHVSCLGITLPVEQQEFNRISNEVSNHI